MEQVATTAPVGDTSFEQMFKSFAKFGDPKSEALQITLSQSDKWMKQAKVIQNKRLTTTDTAIAFKKFKAQKIGLADYKKFLSDLANSKKLNIDEVMHKMTVCGQPELSSAVLLSKTTASIQRRTNISGYTASHNKNKNNSSQ